MNTIRLNQALVRPLLIAGGERVPTGIVVGTGFGLLAFGWQATSPLCGIFGVLCLTVCLSLTRYMAKELGPRRIVVNVLAPGAIETDFGGGAVRDNAQLNAAIAAQTALGRVGLPDDIGGAVAMLLAPETGWINGQRIEFSGGMFL